MDVYISVPILSICLTFYIFQKHRLSPIVECIHCTRFFLRIPDLLIYKLAWILTLILGCSGIGAFVEKISIGDIDE